jgi:hypothetical protein
MADKLVLSEVISRFRAVHGERYDYAQITQYDGERVKLPIACKDHGTFYITYGHHYTRKQGCAPCGFKKRGFQQRKSSVQFTLEAISIHGDLYDYSAVDYQGAHKNVEIICRKHGSFFQTPRNHIRGNGFTGNGCPRCSAPHRYSKIADSWLDYIGISIREFKIPGTTIRVDGYDPSTNTVYQFYGDYWHGNPKVFPSERINAHNKKTFGTLYSYTMSQEQKIKSLRYDLISIWEYDWRLDLKSIPNDSVDNSELKSLL